MSTQPDTSYLRGDMAAADTCYLSVGCECRLTARPSTGSDARHAVEIRGVAAGGYPTLGLHMSRGTALRLAAELLDVIGAEPVNGRAVTP